VRPGRAGSGIKKGGFSFFTRNIFRCEPGKGGGDCKIEYFLQDLDQERFKYRERFVNTGNPGPIQASPPPPPPPRGGGGGGGGGVWG
jgi:hypothetical protein